MHRAPIPDLDHDSASPLEHDDGDAGSAGFPAEHDNPLPDHNPS
ncbi:MAG: hypothetical protein ACRYGK_09830 [Janthinobacterium lividum]